MDSEDPAESEVTNRLNDMSATFSRLDHRGLRAFFTLPCHVTTEERVSCLGNERAFEDFFRTIMDGLRERGFAGSTIAEKHVECVAPRIVVASVLWHRYRGDHEVFERIGAIYTLVNHDGEWRITALVSHSPENVVAFD